MGFVLALEELPPRKPYDTPSLTYLGTLRDLTRGTGFTVDDGIGGKQPKDAP